MRYPATDHTLPQSRNSIQQGALWCSLVFAIILGATRAVSMGDTLFYSNDIADNLGKSPFVAGGLLWEFGHLLWRPLGWMVTSVLRPLLATAANWTPSMQASAVLIGIVMACSIVTVVLWYLLLIGVTRSALVSFAVTLSVACSHGFLLYAHTGFAYIPGLMCLSLSLYLMQRGKPIAAAFSFALSVLLWLPYVLAGLALVIIAACPAGWRMPLDESLRSADRKQAIRFVAISGGCVLLAYGLALVARQTSSISDAKNWYEAASHGWSQNIRVVRIATGLPRSFFYLGKDGILFRRYLRHDPFAPVTVLDLVRASLWKIGLFWVFVVSLLFELIRRSRSRWPLLVLLAGAGPVIFFAVFLFEPGSPERYLPAFPFLVVVAAWVLRNIKQGWRPAQLVMALFLIAASVSNIYSLSAAVVSREDTESVQRVAGFQQRTNNGLVVVLTNQDNLEAFVSRSLFGDINRPRTFPVYDLIEPASLRVLHWREEFAARVCMAWQQGGDVWITKEVWSAQPRPEWNWVEGDDPRISWQEVPRFFQSLQTDSSSGGPDGFRHLARNEANLAVLKPLAAKQN